tara:strand:- start:3795 stop:4022 length:228 start_codon:yes stop_codon:yes gene_type:complete
LTVRDAVIQLDLKLIDGDVRCSLTFGQSTFTHRLPKCWCQLGFGQVTSRSILKARPWIMTDERLDGWKVESLSQP